MAYAARVGAAADAAGVWICAAQTAEQIEILKFREVGKLIEPDHIIFSTLVLIHVLFAVAVAELYPAAVGKNASVRGKIVPVKPAFEREYLHVLHDEAAFQVRIGAPQHQLLAGWIPYRVDQCVVQLRVAFAAARGAAEQHFIRLCLDKGPLPAGDLQVKYHFRYPHPQTARSVAKARCLPVYLRPAFLRHGR